MAFGECDIFEYHAVGSKWFETIRICGCGHIEPALRADHVNSNTRY